MANFSVNAHQGKQLPSNWKSQAPAMARAAEADYLARMENAWRSPLNGSREGITARDARLHNDSSRADSGPQAVRMDGKMQLVSRQDDWEIWRDSVSGATVRKRTK
jgi:hypothetical protein